MLVECSNCGAPLDVAGPSTKVRCSYCGVTSDLSKFKKVAEETPPDWSPPKSWMPSPGSQLPHKALDYNPARAAVKAVARAITFSVFATLALGGFIAWRVASATSDATSTVKLLAQSTGVEGAMTQAMNAIAQAASAAAAAGAPKGPVTCMNNDVMTLSGQTISAPDGIPVVANGNCMLRLVACTLSGVSALSLQGNAQVTIEGGSFTGTGPAVILGGNSVLDASSATFTGEPAFSASSNAKGRVRGSVVTSKRVAIEARNNSRIDADGSSVTGKVSGKKLR